MKRKLESPAGNREMLAPPPTHQNFTLTKSRFVVFVIESIDPSMLRAFE